jgi:hypothetical protein
MAGKTIVISVGVILLFIAGVIGYNLNQPEPVEQSIGSVGAGSIYQSTTFKATTTWAYLFKAGAGTLGSVVINTLGTGNVTFYDASTTNSNLRTTVATTSLRTVGVIDASQAAGTYTYDAGFYDGLIAVFSGSQGTSTVAWR